MNRRTLVVIVVAVALLAIATTIRSGWLYLVSSTLLATIPAGYISAWRSTRGLEIERECPTEVFEGEPFRVRLTVRNAGRFGRYLVTVSDRQLGGGGKRGRAGTARGRLLAFLRADDVARAGSLSAAPGPGSGGPTADASFDSLPPGEAVEASYELVAPRRGVYDCAELRLSSGGVFGEVSAGRTVTLPSRLTVFPAVHPVERFPFDPVVSVAPEDSYEWGRKGIGQDYYGVREYVRGDSLRHIHWKSSARHGRLIVKEYQQEFRPTAGLLLLLEAPRSGDEVTNSLEDGLRAAASLLDYYAGMGTVPRLIVPRGVGFEFVERETLEGCLEVLAGYEPPAGALEGSAKPHLPLGVAYAREMLGQGRSVAVVTNAPTARVARSLGGLNGAEEVSLVLVVEESYGPGWDVPGERRVIEQVRTGAMGRPDRLYFLTRGAEIGRCLSEPLSTTAG